MFLDLARASRRIDGDRHPTGVKNAEKGEEIIRPRGQHEDRRAAGLEPLLLQAGGEAFGAFLEGPIGKCFAFAFVAVKPDVRPVGMDPGMEVQNLGQGGGPMGQVPCIIDGLIADIRLYGDSPAPPGLLETLGGAEDRPQQIAGRFGVGEGVLRQGNPEGAFDPDQKLDPAQAVEAQVLVQQTVKRDRGLG